jgi:hypothetical protein
MACVKARGRGKCYAARLKREDAMINLEDIEDMTCLTREEIAAIAEHEHLPEVNAAALGEYLMHVHRGPQLVQQMICDDIRAALHADDLDHARALFAVLRKFIADHPEAARNSG